MSRGRKKKNRGLKLKLKLHADSHGRDMRDKLERAEVVFKRGAQLTGVVAGVGSEGDDTCVVVMGGTNDETVEGVRVGLNRLKQKLVDKQRVVVVGVPNRYDPDRPPNVEEVIRRKNDLMKNFCDFYKYKFLDISDNERSYFTKHGLHMNNRGKWWLASRIQAAVNSFLV